MLNRPNFLMLNIPNESRPTCKDEHFGIKNSKNLHLPGSHSQPLNNDIDKIISHFKMRPIGIWLEQYYGAFYVNLKTNC
jgi:hypothetical protein